MWVMVVNPCSMLSSIPGLSPMIHTSLSGLSRSSGVSGSSTTTQPPSSSLQIGSEFVPVLVRVIRISAPLSWWSEQTWVALFRVGGDGIGDLVCTGARRRLDRMRRRQHHDLAALFADHAGTRAAAGPLPHPATR